MEYEPSFALPSTGVSGAFISIPKNSTGLLGQLLIDDQSFKVSSLMTEMIVPFHLVVSVLAREVSIQPV
jgi:hypothetical protein